MVGQRHRRSQLVAAAVQRPDQRELLYQRNGVFYLDDDFRFDKHQHGRRIDSAGYARILQRAGLDKWCAGGHERLSHCQQFDDQGAHWNGGDQCDGWLFCAGSRQLRLLGELRFSQRTHVACRLDHLGIRRSIGLGHAIFRGRFRAERSVHRQCRKRR